VLIAGKGNEPGQRINGRTREFDDRASVRRLLYAAGESSKLKMFRGEG
jgi:UDP-N-acetylmuramyl tripeptide synthase